MGFDNSGDRGFDDDGSVGWVWIGVRAPIGLNEFESVLRQLSFSLFHFSFSTWVNFPVANPLPSSFNKIELPSGEIEQFDFHKFLLCLWVKIVWLRSG